MHTRYLNCIVLLFAGLAPLYAQLSNATIKGTVTDPSGAAIPQASLELVNTGTNEHRTGKTNEQGSYDFTALPPGDYKLSATHPGFSAWSGALTLRVSQEAVVNPSLSTAALATSVTVQDVTPVIVTESSELSDVKEAARINALPIQNKNFLNLLNYTPGVVANSFAGQGGGYTRVNGIPGGSMDYLVDGQTAAEKYTNELQRLAQPSPTIQELKVDTSNANAEYSRPGMVEIVTKSGTNAFHGQLYELNQTSNFTAKSFHQQSVNFVVHNEFGGNLGGPVWIPKIYNGKNKTFFFVDAEGIRQSSAASDRYTVPLASWKKGNFSDYVDSSGSPVTIYDPATTRYDPTTGSYVRSAFPGNIIPASRFNPAAVKVLSYIPDPNVNIPFYLGQNYQNPNASAVDNNTLVTVKGDQVLGSNRLSARYTYVDKFNYGPKYFLNGNDRLYGGNNGAISFTQLVSPSMVNEVRAGVQQFHAFRGPVPITPPITGQLGLPTYPGTVAWPGIYFDDNWNYSFDGIDRDNPQDAPGVSINFGDNFSWTHGKHEFKFGFFFQHSAVNTYETGQPGGDYNFSGNYTALMDPAAAKMGTFDQPATDTGAGLADMLLGLTDYSALNQYPHFYTRQDDYAFFAQDNWRVTRRLTLNLGLRYEYWTPFKDLRNQASNLLLNTAGGPTVVYAGSGTLASHGFPQAVVDAYTAAGMKFESASQAGLPSSLWNMQKNNWSPRLGVAYQIADKTVLRGGYGIYYWVMPLVQYHQNTRHNPPFSYSLQSIPDVNNPTASELEYPAGGNNFGSQTVGSRNFGNTFINPSGLTVTLPFNILPWQTDYKTQTAQEWNVTLERQLPWRFGARMSYVGTHSSNLPNYDPINAPIPRALAPAGASPAQRRLYPNFASSGTGSMDLLSWIGYANSNQIQAELKKTYTSGFVFQAFYTYQKTLTTSEGSNNSFGGLELVPAALTNNASVSQRLRMIYARDGELPAQNFSVNTTYELPFGRGKQFLSGANGFVNRIVSGWNATGFFYYRSGLPFAPYYSTRGSQIVLAPGKTGILPSGQQQAAQWFDPSIDRADLGKPYNGQTFIMRANPLDGDFLNNIPRNYMTGPGFYNIDSSFYKVTPITERVKLRIEAQIFNLLNHKNFGLPNNQGVINGGVGLPRLVQFQGKIEF